MTSANHASTTIFSNIADLLTASTMVNDNNVRNTLLQEASMLRAMQQETILPVEQYYFQQEAFLCDVPEIIHEQQHEYGPPRH